MIPVIKICNNYELNDELLLAKDEFLEGASDFKKMAFLTYKNAAQEGHRKAQYILGRYYEEGKGVVPKNERKAVLWFQEASDQGLPAALLKIEIYTAKRFRKEADGGSWAALYNLGVFYEKGKGVSQDDKLAANLFKKAAEEGHVRAQFNLAIFYENGRGVNQDYAEAAKWFKSAAKQDFGPAQYKLSTYYKEGIGVLKKEHTALKWLIKAAHNGIADAQYELGTYYETNQDFIKAEKWFRSAAFNGLVCAKHKLGTYYEEGRGVEKDLEQSESWFKEAARRNYASSQYRLGLLTEVKNIEGAIDWFKKAAEQHLDEAVKKVGYYSLNNFEKIAEHGDANSQYYVGICYEKGKGVAQDYKKAIVWFKKAVEQGACHAEYNLGYCYHQDKNPTEAAKWYGKIAEREEIEFEKSSFKNHRQAPKITEEGINSFLEESGKMRKAVEPHPQPSQQDSNHQEFLKLDIVLRAMFYKTRDVTSLQSLREERIEIAGKKVSGKFDKIFSEIDEFKAFIQSCEVPDVIPKIITNDGHHPKEFALYSAELKVDIGISSYCIKNPLDDKQFCLWILKLALIEYLYSLGLLEDYGEFVNHILCIDRYLEKNPKLFKLFPKYIFDCTEEFFNESLLRLSSDAFLEKAKIKIKDRCLRFSSCVLYINQIMRELIPIKSPDYEETKGKRLVMLKAAEGVLKQLNEMPPELKEEFKKLRNEIQKLVLTTGSLSSFLFRPASKGELATQVYSTTDIFEILDIKTIIDSEIDLLEEKTRNLFLKIYGEIKIHCQRGHVDKPTKHIESTSFDESIWSQIHQFLRRNNIPIPKFTFENAQEYLKYIKLIDWNAQIFAHAGLNLTYQNTSDVLRLEIARKFPQYSFHHVFMRTLVPSKMSDGNLWRDPNNWTNKTAVTVASVIADQVAVSRHLGEGLVRWIPKGPIYAVRGGTCSGKSTYLRELLKNLLFNMQDFNYLEKGILNVDHLKAALRAITKLLNAQVQSYASELFPLLINEIVKRKLPFILDGRFITLDKIKEHLIAPAEQLGHPVSITDLDVSLETMLLRLLLRPTDGEEPVPSLNVVVDGFVELRKHRAEIIEYLKEKAIRYQLLKGPKRRQIREEGKGWKKCMSVPPLSKIHKILEQKIDTNLIDKAIRKGIIPENKKECLEKWNGKSIQEAVFNHVNNQCEDLSVFGEVKLESFTADWLKDYPELVHHLKSEQLLHVRGLDDDWEGLHWPNNKFVWKLNPKYNPEAKATDQDAQGGFQVKLGHFKVSKEKIQEFRSKNLSQEIYTELFKDEKYLFFVHPESYRHYLPLIKENWEFVKPENSDYMGTPSSSYRSWVVRNIKENSTPFIVKFGVLGLFGDTSRLLSKVDVERSIKVQNKLSELKENPLLIFEENLGLVIPGYSGNIIREIPHSLLTGEHKILSFSALMSVERAKKENRGVCALTTESESIGLPLIFEIMALTIKQGRAKNAEEFIEKFLIEGFLKAIKELHVNQGFSFSPHGQNLCMVLKDNMPSGFAYRDLEGIPEAPNGYIETFSFFYRYHVFIKLLNVLKQGKEKYIKPPLGAPSQIGEQEFTHERNLNSYLEGILNDNEKSILDELSISDNAYESLLKKLDDGYRKMHSEAGILLEEIPSAEKGSPGEPQLISFNEKLFHAFKLARLPKTFGVLSGV